MNAVRGIVYGLALSAVAWSVLIFGTYVWLVLV